ncbi:LOW QUALITY PROTEIN: uncharacterized protein LOC109838950 [Asparagus officinalis]|uniref:LOW QUALITY PROTEIN: uncharacterized protein LOC109838950 n=1 Tax=Asparagus officinalis TaxID=4686 RepID=UPI00098E18AD|nr:LOW QUALITY PROTEIN: uncharacterized protein LOC109838950 [Asparagus officinalis]
MDLEVVDCREYLEVIHSKVTLSQLKIMSMKFDIPKRYKLSIPMGTEAIYDHGPGRHPLYLNHLECGLRLPLPPFLKQLFGDLGVLPTQTKSNVIAITVAFVVICSWLAIKPTTKLFTYFVVVKASQREPHYYFQMSGSFKLIVDLPDSHKEWKEKFVWVTGDDLEMGCSDWPEIRRDALVKRALSKEEKVHLESIKKFTISRCFEVLLDRSVLRMTTVSVMLVTNPNTDRAIALITGSVGVTAMPSARFIDPQEESSARSTKRLRSDVPPSEVMLVSEEWESSLTHRRRRKEAEGVSQPTNEGMQKAIVPLSVDSTGKEPAQEKAGSPGADRKDPFPHGFSDVDETECDQLRSCIIERPSSAAKYAKEPQPEFCFEAEHHLDARGSIIGSCRIQELLEEVDLLRANDEVLRQQLSEGSTSDVSQVAKLRRELNETLQERDHADVLARAEKVVTAHAKHQLDATEVTIAKLQEEITRLKSKPLQEVIDEYRQEILDSCHQDIVDEYRGRLASQTEVALACKAGCDYMSAQILTEMKNSFNRLHYPPMVTNYLHELEELEVRLSTSRTKWCDAAPRSNEELDDDDEEIVGGALGLGKRVLLVYELMCNGSLQDALLGRKSPELLDWGRRFSIAADIAKGLQFLHEVCDPSVIHGDIKPSNILLDSQFVAKIADFGLARLKATAAGGADEVRYCSWRRRGGGRGRRRFVIVGVDPKSPKDRKKEQIEDDASVMGETVAESATTAGFDGDEMASSPSPIMALEVASTSEVGGFDRMSVDGEKEIGASSSRRGFWKKSGYTGRDWWWRQDSNVGGNGDSRGGVKDYVMEWIRSEIKKERPKSDWITGPSTVSSEDCLPKTLGKSERRKHQRRLEWWASLDEEREKKEKKSRPAKEWWREEYCEELTKKQQRKRMLKCKSSIEGGEHPRWWQEDDEDCGLPSERKKRRKKKNWSRGSQEWWMDGLSGEMKRTMAGRRRSQDWAAGTEIPKSGRTISSTPSMRGTVCYVAPEYGGGGPLSEKCDIYSFGVLLLVLISGRRPLQVTASPMSEFERANLISWARHLAHLGRLLDLVDPSIKGIDKEQALLCITVALLCIQRSPARRPSIKEIVGMLTGQSDPPHLPIEFSPSPPGGFSFKSRKKAR